MAIKRIPEKIITICDRCKVEGEVNRPGPFAHGLHVKGLRRYMTYQGEACIPCVIDLCEGCQREFIEVFLKEGE